MKKILFAVLLFIPGIVKADKINARFGPLELILPFQSVDVAYLYDIIGQASLMGAETPIAKIWKFQTVFGGVTNFERGKGTPYVGIHMDVTPQLFENRVTVGLFSGYDFLEANRINDGTSNARTAWRAGLKASIPIFGGDK